MALRWWTEGEADSRLDALMRDPDGVLRGPGSLAREVAGRKRFYRLSGEPGLFVKVFALDGLAARLRYWMRPSKARREAAVARGILARGFAAAAPVAVGEERRFGVLVRSLSVIAEEPARDLRAVLEGPGLEAATRDRLVLAFARFLRALHEAGIDQDDCMPNNFLVYDDERFALIDFERCHLHPGPVPHRRRIVHLAKLHRRHLGVRRARRLAFVDAYLGGGTTRAERRRLIEEVITAFRRIRARDARRAAVACTEPGRHLERDGRALQMRARTDLPTVRLERSEADARNAWIRAHQLERLELPALRPVRLDGQSLTLVAPVPGPETDPSGVRRRFEFFGVFRAEPEWAHTRYGPVLANPDAWTPHAER